MSLKISTNNSLTIVIFSKSSSIGSSPPVSSEYPLLLRLNPVFHLSIGSFAKRDALSKGSSCSVISSSSAGGWVRGDGVFDNPPIEG